ncbi:PTS sugar transporter subunit IIA [Streptomyces sp. NPDC004111]|uniref:PTS sugar transporter subunit IIA n=1 Tax=Streptomyces sp. NPDC004111 TaxID=3364690 RepID=UPI0036A75B76
MQLSNVLTPDRIAFRDEPTDWATAVRTVARPLLDAGDITTDYVDAMVASIADGGTYINLGFGIALAHARPESGALRPALSMLRLAEPAPLLGLPEHAVDLYFCLAAPDPVTHTEAMASLARLLSDSTGREELRAARSAADVITLITRIEET